MFDQVELEKLRKVFVTDLAGTLMRAMRLCEDWRTEDSDLGYVSTGRVGSGKGATIAMAVAQVWKSSKFTIERSPGKTPGTVIFRLSGPFTARDMHGALSPDALRNTFEAEEVDDPHALPIHPLHIFDLTEVPYMDSAGLGLIVSHYVRCQDRGVRLVVAGVSPRVVQLFEMTKVDGFFPRIATVEEADRP
jgi:anti-anti-sigma factor